MQKTYPNLPAAGHGQLLSYDLLPSHTDCSLQYKLDDIDFTLPSGDTFSDPIDLEIRSYQLSLVESCGFNTDDLGLVTVSITDEKSTSFYFWADKTDPSILRANQAEFPNQIEKSSSGRPFVKVIWTQLVGGAENQNNTIVLKRVNDPENEEKQEKIEIGSVLQYGDTEPMEISKPTEYKVFLNEVELGNANFKQGGNYNLLVSGVSGTNTISVQTVTPENSFSMFWQLPQYIIMTAGEVLFSITTMEFCYTQVFNCLSFQKM